MNSRTQRLSVSQVLQLLSAALGALGCVVTSDCLGNVDSNCALSPILLVENPSNPDGCTNGDDGCTAFQFSSPSPDATTTTSFKLTNAGDLTLYFNAHLADSTDPRFTMPDELSGSIESGASADLVLSVESEAIGPISAEIVIESNAVNPDVRIIVTANFSD